MRFALVSDIHANWQAWNAVLLDIRSLGADAILCLGDIIGYGPQPAEVLESVHANANYIVLGNHDAVIAGKLDPELFNDTARHVIEWTQGQLGDNAIRFLCQLPLSIDAGDFRCTHGDFSKPAAFNYILDPQDALASWQTVPHPLLFCGHTHEPGIFILDADRTMRHDPPADFTIRPEQRYLINIGSVGQPRDAEARACYVLYDTDTGIVEWRRIPFDLDAYRQVLRQVGLDEDASPFLAHDPRLGLAPVREHMNFSPATSPQQSVQNTVEVQEVRELRRQAKRWKLLTAAALSLTLVGGSLGGRAWWQHSHRALDVSSPPSYGWSPEIAKAEPDANVLPPLEASSKLTPIRGWTVLLGDKRAQAFHATLAASEAEGEAPSVRLVLTSATRRDPVMVSSPRLAAESGMRLQVSGCFLKDADFAGTITMVIALERDDDAGTTYWTDPFLTVPPTLRRRHDWVMAQRTFDVPARTRSIRVHVRGIFTGQVICRDLELRLR